VAFLAAKENCFILWSREAPDRLRGRHDAYPVKLFEHEQVIVSRHNQIGLGGQRTSQHGIIIGIA
jgi:hypothetical protein